jgi:formate/nitrite transporter FocA (FNT family)
MYAPLFLWFLRPLTAGNAAGGRLIVAFGTFVPVSIA